MKYRTWTPHILPHIFLPAFPLLDRGERNLLVSDVGPMDGLERGVLQQFASMHLDRGWKKTVPFDWPRVSDQELIETIEE
jgi:hypothetical protein